MRLLSVLILLLAALAAGYAARPYIEARSAAQTVAAR